ncbi:hypothetical protein O4J55_25780, partial [Paracoccus sp. PXZ]
VSTINGGHYPPLSPRGRAVRPDAYQPRTISSVSRVAGTMAGALQNAYLSIKSTEYGGGDGSERQPFPLIYFTKQ